MEWGENLFLHVAGSLCILLWILHCRCHPSSLTLNWGAEKTADQVAERCWNKTSGKEKDFLDFPQTFVNLMPKVLGPQLCYSSLGLSSSLTHYKLPFLIAHYNQKVMPAFPWLTMRMYSNILGLPDFTVLGLYLSCINRICYLILFQS